jgi:hypothetical protein
VPVDDDAFIVANAALRELLVSRRRVQLDFYEEASHAVASARFGVCKFGRVNSPHAIAIEPGASEVVDRLVDGFRAALPRYALRDFELWMGDGVPTPAHNDAYLYLEVGQAVALQFWVLLEASIRGPLREEAQRDKNALECVLPVAPGLVWPGMNDVIGPAGRVDHVTKRVVGGDEMRVGDVLVFTNGVIHGARGNAGVLRVALAFRAVLAAEQARDDVDLMLWFRDLCEADLELRTWLEQQSNPYYRKAKVRWSLLPPRRHDPARLAKIDHHDRSAVRTRLERHAF